VGIDVAEEREIGVVFLAVGGDGLRSVEGRLILTFAEIGVGEIEFHVVRIGIGFCGGLKMSDGVVVLMIAGEQHADACLGAKIFAAELVKLCDGGAGVVEPSQFQIGFGQQVEILRLARVFF